MEEAEGKELDIRILSASLLFQCQECSNAIPHRVFLFLQIRDVSFKNYYTAFLTMRLQMKGSASQEGSVKWVTCLRNHRLMPNPHTEEGSQDYFSVYRHQVRTMGSTFVSSVPLDIRSSNYCLLQTTPL